MPNLETDSQNTKDSVITFLEQIDNAFNAEENRRYSAHFSAWEEYYTEGYKTAKLPLTIALLTPYQFNTLFNSFAIANTNQTSPDRLVNITGFRRLLVEKIVNDYETNITLSGNEWNPTHYLTIKGIYENYQQILRYLSNVIKEYEGHVYSVDKAHKIIQTVWEKIFHETTHKNKEYTLPTPIDDPFTPKNLNEHINHLTSYLSLNYNPKRYTETFNTLEKAYQNI